MSANAFPNLFSPITLGKRRFRNRIVSTGHETHLNEAGLIGEKMIAYHEARARGGAGMIVVEVALVHPSAVFVADPIRVDSDACIPGYCALAKRVQAHDCRLLAQLFHPGREIVASEDGTKPVSYSASATPNERFRVQPRPMPLAMIAEVIAAYGDAAQRMQTAGLDGVEIVASHGYLPAQFLNAEVNRRDDAYGGSLENRTRFTREIAAQIRARTGPDFVIGLRFSGDERSHDGMHQDETTTAIQMISDEGNLDYLSVVAGSSSSLEGSTHIVPSMFEAVGYTAPLGRRTREATGLPVIVTGRINQPQEAERILAAGDGDMCGMTRAMICDPEIGRKAQTGRQDDIRACIGCNQACIGHFHEGYPISCIQNPVSGRETTLTELPPVATPKHVIVVGGGPAGMKAAAVAAARGHRVTLYEKAAQLGGQALLAQMLPERAEFGGIVTNLAREMELAGVKVALGTEVDRALLEQTRPDQVILATGATPRWPDFEGRDDMHTVDAWQVLRGQANIGGSVVIADWRADWIGMGLAEKLALEGRHVRLAVNGYMPGQAVQMYVRDATIGRLHKLGVEMIPYTRLFGADDSTVYLQHMTSGEPVICEEVDTLVLAQGHDPEAALEDVAADLGLPCILAGDCLSPRTAEEAVLEGYRAGAAV